MTDPKFFKKANNADGAAEFKRCLPVNVNTSFKTLAPAIATVEQQRLKPVLGASLFNEAADYYATNGINGSDAVKNELVDLIQMAVVRLAYWDSFDQLAVMMGDNGISDTNGDNRAYRYQADRLKESLLRQGFSYLNQIVGYCLDHILALPLFRQSEEYSVMESSTIRTLKEMESVVPLNGDYFLFSKLRGYISETEAMELPFRVGQTLASMLTNRDDQRITALMRSARGFVAHWSMAEAVPFLNITMTPQGPVLIGEKDGGSQGGQTANPPRPEMLTSLQQRHREMAERYIGQLVTYCKQHIDTFPEIAEIGISADHEKNALHRDNRGKKTFLA